MDPRLLRRARAVRVLLVVDSVLGVVMALLVLAQAVLLARVAARSFDGASPNEVTTPLVLLVVVVAARALAVWGFEVAGRRAAGDVISQLRLDVVETRLRRQPTALDGTRSAEIASAAVSGVDALETTFARYLPQLVLAAVVPVAVLALVASIDPLAAGLMLLTLPLVPVFMWLVGRHTQRRARERWQALALLSNHFLDVVRGLPTLRAFNRSRAQAKRISEVSDEYRRTTMGTLRIAFLSGSILELAATLGIALVAVVVGVRLAEGGIGFEAALTVLVLVPELYLPLRNLAAQFHASADGAAVAERLLELAEPAPARIRGMAPPDPALVPIRFEGVSFAYPSRDLDVLRDLDLEIRPGETTSIVGPSGVGKSTLVSLLLRLVDPSSGRITVGDDDLAELDATRWRALTALVPQRPTLFRGTVAENIRLGVPAAGDERVRRAAELAGAHDFVARLPLSYGTVVGDGGRQLSAGQRRRIALARAFLRDAQLVLLDEPTADLDGTSAELVAESIDRLRTRRTVVIVAHAPDLAESADRVVRLESGRTLGTAEKAA
ncbi:MAG TPA: thiol reductant ABC exporter subunit CydD [Gaiellaceae bacterium]|nr:thiol reductant ABC exporter subunit CydD [Gaiellaceae bacterium]